MNQIPRIETPRLILRGHEARDWQLCSQMWMDPQVVRYTIQTPSTPQRSWMRMLGYLGGWHLLGFGYWAVEEKSSGLYIGDLGFADFKRGLDGALDGIPELGWALNPASHRKGFATEGLLAATAWVDQHLSTSRTVCIISPDNLPSLRVAQKIGYREFQRGIKEGHPEIFFERPRVR